jgi:hypothetical protein
MRVLKRFAFVGILMAIAGAAFAQFLKDDLEKYARIAKEAKIEPQ